MIDQEIRLEAVERFKVLNMDTDDEFNDLLEMVSQICETPIALLTLIDKDTQWLKAKRGTAKIRLPREIAFCDHTIKGNAVFIVPDTLLDKRFKNNYNVVNEPFVRFYAGAPLITCDGHKIGSLCVVDIQPRILTMQQQLMLKVLSKQAVSLMEMRVSAALLESHKAEFEQQRQIIKQAEISQRSFFESSPNFHVLLNTAGEVIDYNKTAYKFIKKVHKQRLTRGELFAPFVAPDFLHKYFEGFNNALTGNNAFEEGYTDYGEFGVIYWEASFETARDLQDSIIGVSYIIRDVSDRKRHELKVIAQNKFLLKIAHLQAHEVRGPLSSILGIMDLIRAENFEAPREYYELLEKAVINFDHKVKEILSHIDEYKSTYDGNGIAS